MTTRPIVLIHGYSADSETFDEWRQILLDWGYTPHDVQVANYASLTDEVTITDLAKGFDAALRAQPGLDAGEAYDAMVHSTGMLVLRTWAVLFPEGRKRLKHLVGLAPASFGSPLAHKGRSYLGRAVSGNKEKGPDFREAGDRILDALELGSAFTWNLAMTDLVGDGAIYGTSGKSPYVSIFCGTEGYKGLKSFVNEPGTDGTVRLAGAALNTRLIRMDLRGSVESSITERYMVAPWSNADIPVVPVAGLDHSTIVSEPSRQLQDLVKLCLAVDSGATNEAWLEEAGNVATKASAFLDGDWQQLVFHVVDDAGQAVPDYFIEFHVRHGSEWIALSEQEGARANVHTYGADPSYRCFHVDLRKIEALGSEWALSVRASSGTRYVAYSGWVETGLKGVADSAGAIAAVKLRHRRSVEFFFPRTTTLVEVTLDRLPSPVDTESPLVEFPDRADRVAARKAKAAAVAAAEEARVEAELEARFDELEAELRNASKNTKR